MPTPTQDPNCGAFISSGGGTPSGGLVPSSSVRGDGLCPISLYPSSHRQPSEVQDPETSQILGALPWPARDQCSPHSPGSQCCPPTAEIDSDGLCREQDMAGEGGCAEGGVLGARVATWKGLNGPVLTTSMARAQYRGEGPTLSTWPWCPGATWPAQTALMRWGKELHWPRSLCGACAECLAP